MQTTLDLPQTSIPFKSLITISIFAGLITFALFVGMNKLISNKQIARQEVKVGPIIDLHYNFEDSAIIEKKTLKPKPKPIPQPKSVPKIAKTKQSKTWDNNILSNTFAGPVIEKASTASFVLAGGEARPIVRIEPKYPVSAARDGVEGWVRLMFSVSATGEVENIQVIDAQPKRIFNQSAKRALARWKYKPNIVAGKPQSQDGMMVMLDFKLAS
ncbi:energy transducer TonB [Paraglaciecola sp. L3A3]|uniref:energy transducer TonB n=1 Tax=Paraglaciecola sp. L3A3 TaxID=2686358 RepID=UPI001E60F2CE|nr:TonB family protein [Paraglaciecola sp. L3A3]